MSNPRQLVQQQRYDLRLQKRINRSRLGILNFTRFTKPDYEINWHHLLMARKLNQFIRGEIRFLMIFAPPRHGKSEITSRRLPAFIHGIRPATEIMAASYSKELANDFTSDVQRIMDEPEYKLLFPDTKILNPGSMHPKYKRNSKEHSIIGTTKGRYTGQGVGGSFTGKGAKLILIDDPIKGRQAADSFSFRENLWKWYLNDLRTRLAKNGQILLTVTRWHGDDLPARLLKLAKENPKADQWQVLSFEAIRENLDDIDDPRKLGEALWSEHYPIDDLEALKAGDSRGFQALYQQRPTALTGDVVKSEWLQFYKTIPKQFDTVIQSWDLTFKDGKKNDFVCGQVWGRIGQHKYLLDQYRQRTGFAGALRAIEAMTLKWPQAYRKLIEEKANGAAVIETLKRKSFGGIIPINPRESKFARLSAVSTQYEAGDIFYPDKQIADWIDINIDELLGFPNAANDDTVDATSQALNDLEKSAGSIPRVSVL